MCGIVGYITKDDKTRTLAKEKFFREALYTNTLRGYDSTGTMSVAGSDFTWHWAKQAVPGYEYVTHKSFIERDQENWCSVGHNRSATVGEINTDNSHPFQQKHIILVHNGTLRESHMLPHVNYKLKVDSDLLAYNLSKVAPEDAHEILAKTGGAYALVWLDSRDKSINIARNNERPFHMGINAASDMITFASDGYMLNFLCNRLLDTGARPVRIWQLGIAHILKYKKGVMVPEVTKIAPFMRPVYSGGYMSAEALAHLGQYDLEDLDPNHTTEGHPKMGTTITTQTTPGKTGLLGRRLPRPAGRACTKGKIKINDVYRRIPQSMTVMLKDWYSLSHEKNLCFQPLKYWPNGTSGFGRCYGRIWHEEWDSWFDAYVTDVTSTTMGLYAGKQWTVVAAGVDHTSPHNSVKGGVTFICKIQFHIWNGKEVESETEWDNPNKQTEKIDYGDLMDGPHGLITVYAWETLVEEGCVMCGEPIFLSDEKEITWVGEMSNQPLCIRCLDTSTKEFEQDETQQKIQAAIDEADAALASGWSSAHDH